MKTVLCLLRRKTTTQLPQSDVQVDHLNESVLRRGGLHVLAVIYLFVFLFVELLKKNFVN